MSVHLNYVLLPLIHENKACVQVSRLVSSSTSSGRYSVLTDTGTGLGKTLCSMSSSCSFGLPFTSKTMSVTSWQPEVKQIVGDLGKKERLPRVLKHLIREYALAADTEEECRTSMEYIRKLIQDTEDKGYQLFAEFIVNCRPNLDTIDLTAEEIHNLATFPERLKGLTFDDVITSKLSSVELRAYTRKTHQSYRSRKRDHELRYQLLVLADHVDRARNEKRGTPQNNRHLLHQAYANTRQIIECTDSIGRSLRNTEAHTQICNLRLNGSLIEELTQEDYQALFARCLIPGNWVHMTPNFEMFFNWPDNPGIYQGIAKHLNAKSSLDFTSIQVAGVWGDSSPCELIFKAMTNEHPGREIALKVLANSVNCEGFPKKTLEIIKADGRFWCAELWQQISLEYQHLIMR